MYCRKCGSEIKDGDGFCKRCGMAVKGDTPVDENTAVVENTHIRVDTPTGGDTEVKVRKTQKSSKRNIVLLLFATTVVLIGGLVLLIKGKSNCSDMLDCLTKKETVTNCQLDTYYPTVGEYTRFVKDSNTGTFSKYSSTQYYYDEYGTCCYKENLYNADGIAMDSELSTEGYLCTPTTDMISNRYFDYYGNAVENVYLLLPGKEYTEGGLKGRMESNYFTVETSNGIYENCLVKVKGESGEDCTITVYAPKIGAVLEVIFNPDGEVWSWTEIAPVDQIATVSDGDSYKTETTIDENTTNEIAVSPEIQNILDSSSRYYGNNSLILAFRIGSTELWVIDQKNNDIIYHGYMGTQKYRDGWPVTGDTSMGYENELLNFYDLDDGQRVASLTMYEYLYEFYKETVPTDEDSNTSLPDAALPDDAEIINEALLGVEDLWKNDAGLELFISPKKGLDIVYVFNPDTLELIYRGYIDESDGKTVIGMDEGCGEGALEYISEGELKLTVGSDVYQFVKL